jgi:hypothetical protein
MPMHDWTQMEAEIFHVFHHRWILGLMYLPSRARLPANARPKAIVDDCFGIWYNATESFGAA